MTTILYSHDGRGVGHVSRMAALAMGIKRIKPSDKVICITGHDGFSNLHSRKDIDWIKLPSYKTNIENGKVIAKISPAGYNKFELSKIRSEIILSAIKALRPDNFIVEYFPQGKMLELRKSLLYLKKNTKCKIYLGLRGVITDKNDYGYTDVFNQSNFDFIEKIYNKVFCYTDPKIFKYSTDVLPRKILDKIIYTGYVSRAFEIEKHNQIIKFKKSYDKVIGLGCSVNGLEIIKKLLSIKKFKFKKEKWVVFLGTALLAKDIKKIKTIGRSLANVDLINFSDDFLKIMKSSKAVISHGGYNAITDALFFKKPSIFIARDVPEKDQEIHLEYFKKAGVINDYIKERSFDYDKIKKNIKGFDKNSNFSIVKINGSEKVAKIIFKN